MEEAVFASRILDNETQAKRLFSLATERLFNPGKWCDISGPGVMFCLHNRVGKMEEGDLISIKLPVPGDPIKNDWVRVDKIISESEKQEDLLVIRIRPSRGPEGNGKDVSHFFDSETSNNFILWRDGFTVESAVIGRNEFTNQHPSGFMEFIRDTIVSAGARVGFGKVQWNLFVERIFEDEVENGE